MGNDRKSTLTPSPQSLRRARARLITELSAIRGARSLIILQRHLADAILKAESLRMRTGEPDLLDHHLHLLRSIGDGLAWTMVPAHTIRALHRHPGPTAQSASLLGQKDDIGFVFAVMDSLARGGFSPIWSDLTHVLRVGDIIAVSRDHTLILECKNSLLPAQIPSGGRLARQRERGEQRAQYLAESHVQEQDGIMRVALPADWPEPDWSSLQRAVSEAYESSDGMGAVRLGSRDWLVALRQPTAPQMPAPPIRLRSLFTRVRQHARIPMVGVHTDLIREPTEHVQSPLAYPLSAKARTDLLEGTLLLIRMVDAALLEADQLIAGVPVNIVVRDPDGLFPIVATVSGNEMPLSFRHLTTVMKSPVAARAMRRSILTNLKLWHVTQDLLEAEVGELPKHLLAGGDNVKYATVYRNRGGEPVVVVRASDLGISPEQVDGRLAKVE